MALETGPQKRFHFDPEKGTFPVQVALETDPQKRSHFDPEKGTFRVQVALESDPQKSESKNCFYS